MILLRLRRAWRAFWLPPPQPTPVLVYGVDDAWSELVAWARRPGVGAPALVGLFQQRRLLGLTRYGVPLTRAGANGRDYVKDYLEELLDALAYDAVRPLPSPSRRLPLVQLVEDHVRLHPRLLVQAQPEEDEV